MVGCYVWNFYFINDKGETEMNVYIGIVLLAAVFYGAYLLWKSGVVTSPEDKPKDTPPEDTPTE